MNESSFYKGILSIEKSGASAQQDAQNRQDEILALREINEQQIKKIQDLQIC